MEYVVIFLLLGTILLEEGVVYMDDKFDNTTLFGEEVCSEFAWLPLDKQKENAERLANITKRK